MARDRPQIIGEAMIYLWILLSVLQTIDAWSTTQVLRFGGVELDPIMKAFMKVFGTRWALVVTKGLVIAVSQYFMITTNPLPLWFWGGFIGMFGGVVINNLIVLKKMGHL